MLRARLARSRLFHQFEDSRCRGVLKRARGAQADDAREVDTAAQHLVVWSHLAWQGFAREGRQVECRLALHDTAVQRHALARQHHNRFSHGNVFGIRFHQLALLHNVRTVGANLHQGGNAPSASLHGQALEELADLVEEHHSHTLHKVAVPVIDGQHEGSDGGDGHQEILVEHSSVHHAQSCLAQNVVADNQVGRQVEPEA